MNLESYLKLMKFPREWNDLGMIPDEEYIDKLISSYTPGMERASEHDRNGFFHYWLNSDPTEAQLMKLAELIKLELETGIQIDVTKRIKGSSQYTDRVESILNDL